MENSLAHFELLFVIEPIKSNEERDEIISDIEGFINENGGVLNEVEHMGLKRLTYRIIDYTDGYYYTLDFTIERSALKEMNRIMYSDFGIGKSVIRHLLIDLERWNI